MDRGLIDAFEIKFRSAVRDLKSAILLGVMFLALCSMLLTPCSAVQAQQPAKIPRIGYLAGTPLSPISDRTNAFRQGCANLATWRGKTLSLSGGARTEIAIASERSRLS